MGGAWLNVWLLPWFESWEGELLASEGSCTAPGGGLLPSPGGRWAMAGVWLWEEPWLIVWLLTWFTVFTWFTWFTVFIEFMVLLLLLLARLLRELLPSGGGWPVAGGGLSPSPGGRRAVAGVGLRGLGGDWTNLFILLLLLVIFPSFFVTKWLSLLICLCFTLLNLSSLTLLMKSWHCSNLSCEMIEASLSLQSCDSLSTSSKMLSIAFILACNKSFSAFLIICPGPWSV